MAEMVDQTSVPTARNPSSGVYSNDVTFGQRFTVSSAATIQSVSWCRMTAGDARPTHIVVWNETDNVLVGSHHFTSTDDGSTGWHAEDDGPWSLVTGKTYSVGRADPAGGVACGWTTSPPVPPAPFTVTGCYANNQAGSAPASLSVSVPSWELLAVSISEDPAGGGGGGGGVTPADLEAWLSSDSGLNTHQTDGLPWLTKVVVDAISASVGSGLHTAVTAIGTAVTAIGTAVTSTGTAVNGISTSLAAHMATWSDDLAATLQSWNDGLVDWFNKMGGLAGGPVGALSGRSAFPTELWTMADETDWDTDLAWPVPADLYVFTITTPPPGAAADSFAGVTWYHRLGSWTTLDGDQAGARAFLEFSPQQLQDGGRRMPGLALRSKNGTLGHVQAWVLA